MLASHGDPIYLFVPPEEYAEVKAAGACWDDQLKCWYIHSGLEPAKFSPWLGEEADAEFGIASDEAFVASARVSCAACGEMIEVICVYCDSGIDLELDEPMTQFTVSSIWAMDGALAMQLGRWPFFKREQDPDADEGCFANHCPCCGEAQEEYRLHGEPGDVFFALERMQSASVSFAPLNGGIRLSGESSFEV